MSALWLLFLLAWSQQCQRDLHCRGEFTDEYKKTIGVDFLEKQQYVDSLGEDVKLMVWDTAGQEEFDAITRTYYRGRAPDAETEWHPTGLFNVVIAQHAAWQAFFCWYISFKNL